MRTEEKGRTFVLNEEKGIKVNNEVSCPQNKGENIGMGDIFCFATSHGGIFGGSYSLSGVILITKRHG